mgnify:FL=1
MKKRTRGRPPKPAGTAKTIIFSVRLDEQTQADLERIARQMERTHADALRQIIREYARRVADWIKPPQGGTEQNEKP